MSAFKKMFMLASKGNTTELVEIIQSSPDPNIISFSNVEGRNLIHIASLKGNVGCLYELLRLGADVHSKCVRGNTPIHYACIAASLPCIITLLHKNADLRMTNNSGETPLDVIPEDRQIELGSILRKAEEQQKKVLRSCMKSLEEYENFPTASKGNLVAVNSACPIPFITSDFQKDVSQDLAVGPHLRFCRGTFCKMNVSVKYIPNEFYMERKSFLINETIVLGNLRHPNLLLLLGITSPPDEKYQLVFEGIHTFLHRLIFHQVKELDSEQILRMTRDVAAGLHYIHQEGIIHCSMGSHSVIFTDHLTAKICNFDYAQKSSTAKPITHLVSSHPYMSPEQLYGRPADHQNDVFALGLIVFECTTRRKIKDVRSLLKSYDSPDANAFILNLVPKTYENSITALISACLIKWKKRATPTQIYQWTDALLECGLPTSSPLTMRPDDLTKLEDEECSVNST